jgi:Leu/Phe-tRNA-protein transferase
VYYKYYREGKEVLNLYKVTVWKGCFGESTFAEAESASKAKKIALQKLKLTDDKNKITKVTVSKTRYF